MSSSNDDDDAESNKSPPAIKSEIAVLLRQREAVPITAAFNNRDEQISMAKHLRAIAVKIEERELQLESIRVAEVAREYKELHPSTLGYCPICLEELVGSQLSVALCCGGKYCKECGNAELGKCPLCRGDIPGSEEIFRIIQRHAEEGRAWAQFKVGACFELGSDGVNVNEDEAIRWYTLAAEQEDTLAYFRLGRIHAGRNSYANAYQFLKKASNLGISAASGLLGELSFGVKGVKKDMAEAARYFTLAIADDPDDPDVSYRLGLIFLFISGEGLETSLVRAKYYLEIAAQSNSAAYYSLGVALNNLTVEQYHGVHGLPGQDNTPRALYFFRKASADEGNVYRSEAANSVENLERRGQSYCANCRMKSEYCPEKLKCCTRCRAVWYCGTVCQRKHWRKGHKVDCIECSK